ncbi:MAG: helix-turn-helix transcriptional regulator, partial [Clostridiales bacterium]|nr:helix-turn-helix transcriptional regulator [Clostridiales bacterium]
MINMYKTGEFLAKLRSEKNLTQEELGEIIGVSNKTVSRWESGKYLPPVEMLDTLAEFYGVSINEIIYGERIDDESFKQKAEENIKDTLAESSFSRKERLNYFKSKWMREHRGGVIAAEAMFFGANTAAIVLKNYIVCPIAVMAIVMWA